MLATISSAGLQTANSCSLAAILVRAAPGDARSSSVLVRARRAQVVTHDLECRLHIGESLLGSRRARARRDLSARCTGLSDARCRKSPCLLATNSCVALQSGHIPDTRCSELVPILMRDALGNG